MSSNTIDFLNTLEGVIRERATQPANDSYTAKLLAAGTRRIAQKVGEEGVEVALAATAGERAELLEETADLLYHLLVLLADSGVRLSDAVAILEARHGR
ncbi:phosphoribosyl-ATP diphosphatase [Woeseia oceani]|uniref:Phosphoribosyl-ATP pyrophosphatase n=1 Tax=Woeseia oceani TaxID=1548547 RepID=A0A193LG52_9GAMM|nr:phosphoribosyl-ATP diphosphatase [Woeseia oceani]ANO51443.1 phosphoribosyl-ATP diphosphatase [Woeseia oceani]